MLIHSTILSSSHSQVGPRKETERVENQLLVSSIVARLGPFFLGGVAASTGVVDEHAFGDKATQGQALSERNDMATRYGTFGYKTKHSSNRRSESRDLRFTHQQRAEITHSEKEIP